MPPDIPVLYVARHGQTILNAQKAFRGSANPPLDETGIKQAHKLASLFSTIDISHIFCSDKQRATKTAQIIADAKGAPIHESEALRALDVGDFSGAPRNTESEAELQKFLDRPQMQIPGGESLAEFKSRIRPCIMQAIELYCQCGSPPLVVAHSSVVHEIGDMANSNHKSVLVEPGGVIAVYYKDGKLSANPIFRPVKAAETSHAGSIT